MGDELEPESIDFVMIEPMAPTPHMLHAEVSGSGTPIVMIHGYLASSHYYSGIAKRLETTHRVVRVDLLGHGKSPKPRDIPYSYNNQIQALHYTLDQLDIKPPFALVGHSMGSLIALRYAHLYPERVSRLVLFNPPMFSSPEQAYADIAATGLRYRVLLFSKAQRMAWRALKMLPRNPSKTRHPVSLTDVLRVNQPARIGSLRNVVMHGNVFQEVEQITTPTLIVVGQKDRVIYLKNAMQAHFPPHVTLKINPHGHNAMAFRPHLAEAYIREHLEQ